MNIALTVTDVAKVKGIVTAVSDDEFRLRWQNFRQMSKLFKMCQLPPSLGTFYLKLPLHRVFLPEQKSFLQDEF